VVLASILVVDFSTAVDFAADGLALATRTVGSGNPNLFEKRYV
jgi:hypothetical protein